MDKLIDLIRPNGNNIEDNNGKKSKAIDLESVEDIIDRHGNGAGSLLNILNDIQDHYGYLSQEVLRYVSRTREIPLTQIFHVVTFNRGFNLIQNQRWETEGSNGTTWHIGGAQKITEMSNFDNDGFHLRINDKKCVSCGLCVKACEEVSGACALRFSRQVIYGEVKKPFLEFPEACTGCGECAKVCPTKAITIDYEVEKMRSKQKVVKCDGCAGYDDRACVVNCPTGALKAIPLDEYLSQHKISYNIELRDMLKQSLKEKGEAISPL
ncbi:MAG: 4Fe-4S dicluster domain-containing protein [bacterium]